MTNALLFLAAIIALAAPQSGTGNLLADGIANEGGRGWKAHGVATIEEFAGVRCFTVRARGSFSQEVPLSGGAAGMHAVLLGRGQSERINGYDGSITGLPYLYATAVTRDRRRYLAYWQGQGMLARPEQPTDWVKMWGVFRVPEGAAYISVQLNQAERKNSGQDGSAARFADVQMHLFSTEAAARKFVDEYLRP